MKRTIDDVDTGELVESVLSVPYFMEIAVMMAPQITAACRQSYILYGRKSYTHLLARAPFAQFNDPRAVFSPDYMYGLMSYFRTSSIDDVPIVSLSRANGCISTTRERKLRRVVYVDPYLPLSIEGTIENPNSWEGDGYRRWSRRSIYFGTAATKSPLAGNYYLGASFTHLRPSSKKPNAREQWGMSFNCSEVGSFSRDPYIAAVCGLAELCDLIFDSFMHQISSVTSGWGMNPAIFENGAWKNFWALIPKKPRATQVPDEEHSTSDNED